MLSDIVPMLSSEKRHSFREFVKTLKAKRDAREIPSLSEALMEQAPSVVGADLWQQCIDLQRADAARQAAAAELEVAVLVVVELRPYCVEAPNWIDRQGIIGAVDVCIGFPKQAQQLAQVME